MAAAAPARGTFVALAFVNAARPALADAGGMSKAPMETAAEKFWLAVATAAAMLGGIALVVLMYQFPF